MVRYCRHSVHLLGDCRHSATAIASTAIVSGSRRSKRYKYRSWKGGSICLESCAESREYMLTYFWGMGTYFYWGDGNIYLLGGWVEILGGGGGMNTPIPPGFAPLSVEKIVNSADILRR